MPTGTVVDLNPTKGMFLVAVDGGDHAVFTLYSAAVLTVGAKVSGALDQQGSEWLSLETVPPQRFEAFGESGPCSREAGLQMLRS